MGALGCRRCGDTGHWADACPHQQRAHDKRGHEGRIALYVRRFIDGEIDAIAKREMIRAENESWYGSEIPAALKR